MTVERRDRRSDRRRVRREVRTGMVALLSLAAVTGCGQTYLRPEQVPVEHWPKVPPRVVSAADPAHAGGPTAKLAELDRMARTRGPVQMGTVQPLARQVREDVNGPLFYQPTTWNGWKVPTSKPVEAVASTPVDPPSSAPAAAVAPISSPAPAAMVAHSPAGPTLPSVPSLYQPAANAPGAPGDPLMNACRDSKIAPPRAVDGKAGDQGADQLLSACRDTKIAPPMRRSEKVASATPAPMPAPAPPVAATAGPQVVATQPAPAETVVVPPTRPEPTGPVVVEAPVAAGQPLEPAKPEVGSVQGTVSTAPQPEPDAPLIPPPAELPLAAAAPQPGPTVAPALTAEPGAPRPVTELPTLSVVGHDPVDQPPAKAPPAVAELPAPETATPLETAGRETQIPMPVTPTPVDPLTAASQATNIPLPAPLDPADPLEAACRQTQIPLPVPAEPVVDPLANASRESQIPLPRRPEAGSLEDACLKAGLPLPVPASDH